MKITRKVLIALAVLLFVSCTTNGWTQEVSYFEWDPPTQNEDNSPLDDLAGYRLYYSTQTRIYDVVLDVGNVVTTPISLMGQDGMYFCSVTAYDVWGNESDFSNEVEILKKNGKYFTRDNIKPKSVTFRAK